MSQKLPGSDINFSNKEVTLKKYVDVMWKFFEIWSLSYRRNLHVESRWIQAGVPVRFVLYEFGSTSNHCSF